jgi:hypothetical protein
MGMMERYMEGMNSMMGGGMGVLGGTMGVMLVVAAFLVFVWVLGLTAIVGLGVWGVRRLSASVGQAPGNSNLLR